MAIGLPINFIVIGLYIKSWDALYLAFAHGNFL